MSRVPRSPMVISVGTPLLSVSLAHVLWARGPGSVQAGPLHHCSLPTPCTVRGALFSQRAQTPRPSPRLPRLSLLSIVLPPSPSFWRSATSRAYIGAISNQIHKQSPPSWAPSQHLGLPCLYPLREPLPVTQSSLIPQRKRRPVQVLSPLVTNDSQ